MHISMPVTGRNRQLMSAMAADSACLALTPCEWVSHQPLSPAYNLFADHMMQASGCRGTRQTATNQSDSKPAGSSPETLMLRRGAPKAPQDVVASTADLQTLLLQAGNLRARRQHFLLDMAAQMPSAAIWG